MPNYSPYTMLRKGQKVELLIFWSFHHFIIDLHGFEIFSDTKYRIFVLKYLQISDSDFDVPMFQVI